MEKLREMESPLIREVRGAGLWVGVDFDPAKIEAKTVCKKLIDHKLLSKETHHTVIRFAPPLIITKEEIDWALEKIELVIRECEEMAEAA
jgi:ornithine--oxo-acid transaminase